MSTQSRILSTTYMSIYDFSICGVSLLGRFSSAYPATISPASKCLAVPRQVFANLVGWLPLTCPGPMKSVNASKGAEGLHPQENLCWLSEVVVARRNHPQDWSQGTFPSFAFGINGNRGQIRVSLEQFVFRRDGRN